MQATTLRKPSAIASAVLIAAALAYAGTGHAAGPQGAGPKMGAGPHGAGSMMGAGPHGPGPMMGAGAQGPGGGMHMSGGMVEHILAQMKDRLALDSSQQQMFETARAQTLAARDQALAQRAGIRATIDAELAKPEPDLAAIAAMFEGAEEQTRASRRQARDQWLKLYANLRADQKVLVRDALRERVSHADTSRERIRERMQKRTPS